MTPKRTLLLIAAFLAFTIGSFVLYLTRAMADVAVHTPSIGAAL